jgi:DNA repair exonuclease SbcCD ATPase subunit
MKIKDLETRFLTLEEETKELRGKEEELSTRVFEIEKTMAILSTLPSQVETLGSELKETREAVISLTVQVEGLREEGRGTREISDKIFSLLQAKENLELRERERWSKLKVRLTRWYMWIFYLFALGLLHYLGLLEGIGNFLAGLKIGK